MGERHRSAVASDEDGWIVSLVRELGSASRPELSRRTGMSKRALAGRLRALRERGILEEVGVGASSGGRPPTLLRLAKDSGHVVAVDLGATHLRVAVTNLNAEYRVCLSEDSDVTQGPDVVLGRARALIDQALATARIPAGSITGMGVGVVGPVDFDTGRRRPVSAAMMPGWDVFPIRDHFEAAYGWPVFIDNDVNVMAMGEHWAGIARGIDDFFYVKIGRGIGCGIVWRGEVYRGAHGWAGELGHIAVPGSTAPCHCGKLGCLGAVAGGRGLARIAEELARGGTSPALARRLEQRGSLTAEDLGGALTEGDPVAAEAIRRAGIDVGSVLGGLVNFCNPSLIVVGGEVTRVGDLLLASIRESVYRSTLPLSARHLNVVGAGLGDDAPLIGAAAMVVRELYRLMPSAALAPA